MPVKAILTDRKKNELPVDIYYDVKRNTAYCVITHARKDIVFTLKTNPALDELSSAQGRNDKTGEWMNWSAYLMVIGR